MTLDEIRRPIEEEMRDFEPFFRKQLQSPNRLLSVVVNYLLRRKGKQMRPMLVFLSAKATGKTSEASHTAAALIELLHSATLVHDDVVDETYQRRGQFSVNAIWNSKVGVLVGDFLLARGLRMALDSNQIDILRIVSEAVGEISEGELLQIYHARKLDVDEAAYYEIIRMKTATLIEACTKAGAYSTGADEATVACMADYGNNLGMAFQIRDDIFDYERKGVFGKPAGNDIKERKMTLPLIYALRQATTSENRQVMRQIARHYKEDKTVNMVCDIVTRYGGIDYAREVMMSYAQKAKDALAPLPDTEAKASLVGMVDFNTIRNR